MESSGKRHRHGQGRGNSGVFLASTGPGDDGYELQVLDSYNNPTYVNGQAASIYKQSAPLVNPNRKPGEWQTYDIVWTAPRFNDDGSLKSPAFVTVLFNGVLVQNHFALKGQTLYRGIPFYKKYDRAPIKLQAHRRQERAHQLQKHLGAGAAVASRGKLRRMCAREPGQCRKATTVTCPTSWKSRRPGLNCSR